MIAFLTDDIENITKVCELVRDGIVKIDAMYETIEEAYIGYTMAHFYKELPTDMRKVSFNEVDERTVINILMEEDDDIFEKINMEIDNALQCHIIDKMNVK